MPVANTAASILGLLQAKTRPMVFAPGTYNFTAGTVVSGVSGDITGGYPRGMTTFGDGLELQVSSTRRQTIRNMRFTRSDGGEDGRTLSIGPHAGLDLINCELLGGEGADDTNIYGWPCRVRMFNCVIGAIDSIGKGFLVAPNTPSNPAPQGSVSLLAHRCEFRTAGIRNPALTDAAVFLMESKVWRGSNTVTAATGTCLYVVNTQFFSTKHPAATATQPFVARGIIHIHTDWNIQSGSYQSQIQPQIFLKNCTLDGRRATRKDLCSSFTQVAGTNGPCPDDSYFIPGSD